MIDRFDPERARAIQNSADLSVKLLAFTRGEMPTPYVLVTDATKIREDERQIVEEIGTFFLGVLSDPKVLKLRKKYNIGGQLFFWPSALNDSQFPLYVRAMADPDNLGSYLLELEDRTHPGIGNLDSRKEKIKTTLESALPGGWEITQETDAQKFRTGLTTARKKFIPKDLVANREFFFAFIKGVNSTLSKLWEEVMKEVQVMSMTGEQAMETQTLIEACRAAAEILKNSTPSKRNPSPRKTPSKR